MDSWFSFLLEEKGTAPGLSRLFQVYMMANPEKQIPLRRLAADKFIIAGF